MFALISLNKGKGIEEEEHKRTRSPEYDEQFESRYNHDYNEEPYQRHHHRHKHETFSREYRVDLSHFYRKMI